MEVWAFARIFVIGGETRCREKVLRELVTFSAG